MSKVSPHPESSPTQNAVMKQKPDDCCSDCWNVYCAWARCALQIVPSELQDAHHIASLRHMKKNSRCGLCRFFWQVRWKRPHGDLMYGFENLLYGFNYGKLVPGSAMHKFPDTLLVGVIPHVTIIPGWSVEYDVTSSPAIGFINTIDSPLRMGPVDNNAPRNQEELAQKQLREAFYGRRVSSSQIDYQVLRNWLRYDNTGHKQRKEVPAYVPINLIDTHSRCVVPAPEGYLKFVALSYVWGKNGERREECQIVESRLKLPDRCPRTIEDALSVATNLAFRYVWVDQYCISKDPRTRHSQIANMDLIYKMAPVTIIAAAGHDSEYGLPGVSRSRVPQQRCRVGHISLVSVRLDAIKELNSSTYSTRGWTYQEKILSERIIVFTDSQVFMQVADTILLETLSTPAYPSSPILDNDANDRHLRLDVQVFDSYHKFTMNCEIEENRRINHTFDPLYGPGLFQNFTKHIELYTARELSYDFDALNAIAAILTCFEHKRTPLKNFYGIPYQDYPSPHSGSVTSMDHTFLAGLGWAHLNSGGMLESKRFRRRSGFPSWSWAGWEGQVCWPGDSDEFFEHYRESNSECSTSVCIRCNVTMPETSCSQFYPVWPENPPKSEDCPKSQTEGVSYEAQLLDPSLLLVEAQTIIVDFQERGLVRGLPELIFRIFLKTGLSKRDNGNPEVDIGLHACQWDLRPELQQMSTGRLLAICLGLRHDEFEGCVVHLLVVTEPKTERDWAERVGLLVVPVEWYMKQDKEERKFLFG